MRFLWLVSRIAILLVVCTGFAASDSIELRNGRHVQGKYVGGTSAVVGFMTGSTIEYFAISDVLALIFDRNLDSPLGSVRPDPMKEASPRQTFHENSRRIRVGTRTKGAQPDQGLSRVRSVTTPVI
jgi:hypothetical protein